MPQDAPRQLASIAAVTEDLDKILDRLFANVAELKAILGKTPDPPSGRPQTPGPSTGGTQ
jgi:hypothetical protein